MEPQGLCNVIGRSGTRTAIVKFIVWSADHYVLRSCRRCSQLQNLGLSVCECDELTHLCATELLWPASCVLLAQHPSIDG
eukprot:6448671-Amphidinium_carterae.1